VPESGDEDVDIGYGTVKKKNNTNSSTLSMVKTEGMPHIRTSMK